MAYTLVVFGGHIYDIALATDFVVISKKFISDGLNPTCLSGTDLADITNMSGPLLFGRDDMRTRTQVYDSDEARVPFYQLSAPSGTKRLALNWIQNVAPRLRQGDRVVIVFIAHGERNSSNIILSNGPRGNEYLSRTEVIAALSVLPAGVRVLLINEACFSGSWTTAAPELGGACNVMVETASTINERGANYRSASGRYRCSLFATAHIEELNTYPEGRISQHYTRIKEEMRFVAPDQDTCTPFVICSPRSWLSHNISHFVLSPMIANAITDAASHQGRHETMLRSRMHARDFWARVTPQNSAFPGSAHSDSSDTKLLIIQDYLKELGSAAAEQNRCTLATACHLVLDGVGGNDLKDKVIKTIAWQDVQLSRVNKLLSELVVQGVIACLFEATMAQDYQDEFTPILAQQFHQISELDKLYSPPPDDGYVDVFFEDAGEWLIGTLALNRVISPFAFDMAEVMDSIINFLQENPVNVMLE